MRVITETHIPSSVPDDLFNIYLKRFAFLRTILINNLCTTDGGGVLIYYNKSKLKPVDSFISSDFENIFVDFVGVVDSSIKFTLNAFYMNN